MESQKTQNSQCNIEEQTWRILPNCKADYKPTVIKTIWYWLKNGQIDQWNKVESLGKDPHKHGQLISDRSKSNIMEQKLSFQQMVLAQWDFHVQKNGSRHRPYTLSQKLTQKGSQS